ncbi:MAG TPA: RNA polymerase sigma factor [Candidatus Cybelea sp.]|nr:RNA polymerase sigma factor [Candidatus Cybelea sp.]
MLNPISMTQARELDRAIGAVDDTFPMDEQSFRTFYEATARRLWSYLYRMSGNATLADDLLQESYYRLLRARLSEMSQDYLKNYLFRIATNLLRDHWRRTKIDPPAPPEARAREPGWTLASLSGEMDAHADLVRVMGDLKPRERELLWLAYVEGSSHREIAQAVGLREQSVRGLLFRARTKLARLLRRHGVVSEVVQR